MINLKKQNDNTFVVTLTEKTTVVNPTYLFSFENVTTNESYEFILIDSSQFPDRYNSFDILVSDLSSMDLGQYDYTIYAQTSTINLNPAYADEIVETGIMKLTGVVAESQSYEPSQSENTYTPPTY